MKASDWWRGATFYQAYLRSYADSNADGIGDLPGLTARLDHIAGLGVDGVWISPFFPSPMRDFGYDVTDHCGVDPMFGTLADFDALLARAHVLGLKVIIDQVWSHTAIEHPWFADSRSSRDGARADWYVWADAKADGSPPSNWLSWMGGPAWTWDPRRRQYYLHNFLPQMPDLNFHCPAVQDAILEAARFWLDRGVDGFRLDTANYYHHDPAFTDNPPQPAASRGDSPVLMQQHLHNVCQPQNLPFLERLRALMDAYPQRMTVAEIGSAHALQRMVQYTQGRRRLHTAYSFLLLGDRHDPAYIAELMAPWQQGPGARAWPSWAFSNHDVPRVASRWAGAAATPQRCQQLIALLLCLRGTVFLYQGEELGLTQSDVPFEQLQDPFGKNNWPIHKGRDGCRTPMPWRADAPTFGFTAGTPWLPADAGFRDRAVDLQEADPGSTLNFTRRMIALRRAHAALRLGSFEPLVADDTMLVVRRRYGRDRLLAAFNLGGLPRSLPLPGPSGAEPLLALGEARLHDGQLALAPGAALILPLPA